MNRWILTLPREDMEHCIRIGTFGFNSKSRLGQIAVGDQVLCCVTGEKPWKIIGIGEATSAYYVDDKPIFKKTGGFWYRFDFKSKHLSAAQEVDFNELIPSLSFITNVVYWPVYFKGGVKSVNEDDWKLILKHVR